MKKGEWVELKETMGHFLGVGAEKERKREKSGWKPRSGNRSSGRRQVVLVEGTGPEKWGPSTKGEEGSRNTRILGWPWKTTCQGGWMCGRQLSFWPAQCLSPILLGIQLWVCSRNPNFASLEPAPGVSCDPGLARHHMPLATAIGSGMACVPVRTNQS